MNNRYLFYQTGFHGDKYLIRVIDSIISGCEYFIETGTNVASTLAYVAKKYPHVKCMSCESDHDVFKEAIKNTHDLSNALVFNEESREFMKRLEGMDLFNKGVLFWLDAHGYGFKWPLRDEIKYITSKFQDYIILVDDFKVPGLPCFGFDSYNEQECSFEYIADCIAARQYFLYYPEYCERTSRHHPLRGWGMISNKNIDELINIKAGFIKKANL